MLCDDTQLSEAVVGTDQVDFVWLEFKQLVGEVQDAISRIGIPGNFNAKAQQLEILWMLFQSRVHDLCGPWPVSPDRNGFRSNHIVISLN